MVRQFHDWMQVRVQTDGKFTEPFEVTNGIKQGLATLLSMMFSAMLKDAYQDSVTGFPTVFMAIYSTVEGRKPKLRCRLMC